MTCREVKLTQQPKLTVGEEPSSLGLSYTLDSTACLVSACPVASFYHHSRLVWLDLCVSAEVSGPIHGSQRYPPLPTERPGVLNEAMQQGTAHSSQSSRRYIASHSSTGVNLLCLFWSSLWNVAITGHEGEGHLRGGLKGLEKMLSLWSTVPCKHEDLNIHAYKHEDPASMQKSQHGGCLS